MDIGFLTKRAYRVRVERVFYKKIRIKTNTLRFAKNAKVACLFIILLSTRFFSSSRYFLCLFFLFGRQINSVEKGDVHNEDKYNQDRVNNGIATH